MLQDTATALNAFPRQPTKESFVPIGHISLDSKNPDAEHIGLDLPSENIFWIKSFYVGHAIQGQGIGRATMDEVEAMAVREPLSAKTLMLDTVQKDDQNSEEFANAAYGSVPKVRSIYIILVFQSIVSSSADYKRRVVCSSRLSTHQKSPELLCYCRQEWQSLECEDGLYEKGYCKGMKDLCRKIYKAFFFSSSMREPSISI